MDCPLTSAMMGGLKLGFLCHEQTTNLQYTRIALIAISNAQHFKLNCNFKHQFKLMSKEEIKYEISKVLDHFSDKALSELLSFLKELDKKRELDNSFTSLLNQIISEDKELLTKLAQ